jgi:hypothetical protein
MNLGRLANKRQEVKGFKLKETDIPESCYYLGDDKEIS